jgi:hypothetical protein
MPGAFAISMALSRFCPTILRNSGEKFAVALPWVVWGLGSNLKQRIADFLPVVETADRIAHDSTMKV